MITGSLLDVGKHLGSLKFKVWERMMENIQYSEYHSVSNYQVISTLLHLFIVNHYQEMSGSNLTKKEKNT